MVCGAGLQGHQPAEGRSAVTGKEIDRFNFKVPTSTEMTHPYFHDGAVTPGDVVMGRLQAGAATFTMTRQVTQRPVAF